MREEAKRLMKNVEVLFYNITNLPIEKINISHNKYGSFVPPIDICELLGADVYKQEYVNNQRTIKSINHVSLENCFKKLVNGVDCRVYLDDNKGVKYYKVVSQLCFDRFHT